MNNDRKSSILYQGVMLFAILPAIAIALIGWRYASDIIPDFVYLIVGLAASGVAIAGFILCASRMIAGKECDLSCYILQIVYGGVLAGLMILTIVGLCM